MLSVQTLRWHNHLDPNINRSEWTQQEDEQLVLLHAEVGNQWAVLARSMPGRTDNAIKNRWNATLHKRVLSGDYNYLLQEGQCVRVCVGVVLEENGEGIGQQSLARRSSFHVQEQDFWTKCTRGGPTTCAKAHMRLATV